MDNRPIGIFDSGLGGLTVVKEIKKILPNEQIIYLGDTARVPYGTRGRETVIRFALEDALFLTKFKIKCLVIACNTASAFAYQEVAKMVGIPVIDMIIPGSIGALRDGKTKIIAVIGTKGAIDSNAYKSALKKKSRLVSIYQIKCPLFVPLIEEGEISGKLIKLVAVKYLSPLKKLNIDTLIMGCTHYPIIKNIIKSEVGSNVKLINPGAEAAVYLRKHLLKNNSLSELKKADDKYFLTDLSCNFIYVAEKYLGEKISDKIRKASL